MMESILAPFDPNGYSGFLYAEEDGLTAVGKVLNIAWEEIERTLYFEFEYELESDIESGEAALFIMRNGRYYAKLSNGETNWSFTPAANSTYEAFEFFLGPNYSEYANLLDAVRIANSVTLHWTFYPTTYSTNDTKALRIKHCVGSGTPDTTLATLTRIGAQTNGENGPVSNSAMYASGKWEDPDTLYTSINVAITTAGDTDEAEYTWTWEGNTGTGICHDYYDHILNGIKIKFETTAPYAIGDEWDIIVSLPESWTSPLFTDGGVHTFGVNSVNSAGDEATGPTVEETLYIPPEAPVIKGTPVYIDASGEIEITWTAPSSPSSSLASYRVYRNYAHLGIDNVDWAYDYTDAVAAGADFTVTVTALEEGLNRIQATVVDELGLESALSIAWEITLNSSLNVIGTLPNSPDSISGKMNTSGDIVVTVVVDSTSDTINLYHDNHTGTVDYGTVVDTITNPKAGVFQALTGTLTSLTDGIYIIAARCSNAGAEETNTDLICTVLRDKDTPAIVSLLTARAVYA